VSRDFHQEAESELARTSGVKAWIQLRIRNIHERLSAHDVLRRFGVELRYQGDDHEEQFKCPFHGKDNKPSARVYPPSGGKPGGAWCFVCQERWDTISLWRKYTDETRPFTQVLADIEREYNIPVPEPPKGPVDTTDPEAIPEDIQKLLDACESRLRADKMAFEPRAHLTLGVLLDRVRWQLATNRLKHPEARQRVRRILDKIGEKIRCQET
jgi:hypothetical protein